MTRILFALFALSFISMSIVPGFAAAQENDFRYRITGMFIHDESPKEITYKRIVIHTNRYTLMWVESETTTVSGNPAVKSHAIDRSHSSNNFVVLNIKQYIEYWENDKGPDWNRVQTSHQQWTLHFPISIFDSETGKTVHIGSLGYAISCTDELRNYISC